MRFVEYIRSKKPDARGKYAFFLAVGITGAVALVWMTTLPAQLQTATFKLDLTSESSEFGTMLEDVKSQTASAIETLSAEPPPAFETSNLNMLSGSESGAEESVGSGEGTFVPKSDDSQENAESAEETPVSNENHVYVKPEPKMILIGTTTAHSRE